MRICDFKILKYEIPCINPLPGTGFKKREGFIIKLTDETGHNGYGESAPLSGLSTEMPEIVLDQLKNLRKDFEGQNVPSHIGPSGGKFSHWLDKRPLSPSVHFGFETAVLSLKASVQKKLFSDLIFEDASDSVTVNGLLQSHGPDLLSEAETLLKNGFQTIKVKVGRQNINDDIDCVNQLSRLIKGKAILRLDANRAWELKEAVKFCEAVDFGSIEYIEEPLKNFSDINEFYEKVQIPVAVDESLKSHSLRDLKQVSGLEVVILKPTLLGGIEKIFQMSEEARAYGLRTVITSTYESGIGLRALANLASCFSKHTAVGLDTSKWFAGDTVQPSLPLDHGRLQIEKCQLGDLRLNPSIISEA